MFGFARDRGLPPLFCRVDKNGTPVYTIWLAAFLAFCLALPSLGSSVAFTAATSIATIGLYISYSFPILIGLIWGERFDKLKGPFNLGKIWSKLVAAVACAWTVSLQSEAHLKRD
jgi:amino acid transporter